MTTKQFAQAVKLAEQNADSLCDIDNANLFGCALPSFQKVHTTIPAVAKLVHYQAMQFNGKWSAEELDNMARIAKKKFLIIG
jgi:hypothetical protein